MAVDTETLTPSEETKMSRVLARLQAAPPSKMSKVLAALAAPEAAPPQPRPMTAIEQMTTLGPPPLVPQNLQQATQVTMRQPATWTPPKQSIEDRATELANNPWQSMSIAVDQHLKTGILGKVLGPMRSAGRPVREMLFGKELDDNDPVLQLAKEKVNQQSLLSVNGALSKGAGLATDLAKIYVELYGLARAGQVTKLLSPYMRTWEMAQLFGAHGLLTAALNKESAGEITRQTAVSAGMGYGLGLVGEPGTGVIGKLANIAKGGAAFAVPAGAGEAVRPGATPASVGQETAGQFAFGAGFQAAPIVLGILGAPFAKILGNLSRDNPQKVEQIIEKAAKRAKVDPEPIKEHLQQDPNFVEAAQSAEIPSAQPAQTKEPLPAAPPSQETAPAVSQEGLPIEVQSEVDLFRLQLINRPSPEQRQKIAELKKQVLPLPRNLLTGQMGLVRGEPVQVAAGHSTNQVWVFDKTHIPILVDVADIKPWSDVTKSAPQAKEPLPAAPPDQAGKAKPLQTETPPEIGQAGIGPQMRPGFVITPQEALKQVRQTINEFYQEHEQRVAEKQLTATGVQAMRQHWKLNRAVDLTPRRLANIVNDAIVPARQDLFADAVEMGPNSVEWADLSGPETDLAMQLRDIAQEANKKAVATGLIRKAGQFGGTQIHVYHSWLARETERPYAYSYGRFAKSTPQAKARLYQTLAEGRASGLKPAGNVGQMIGEQVASVGYAVNSRNMYKSLAETALFRSWNDVVKNGEQGNYSRVSDAVLRKKIRIRQEDGSWRIIGETDGAIDKELYPFWNAYRNNPNYGTLSQLNFVTRAWKLALSMFHPATLIRTAAELQWNPIEGFLAVGRGHRIMKNIANDPVARLLYEAGQEVRGYDPFYMVPKGKLFRKLTLQEFIFENFQPKLKWGESYPELVKQLSADPSFDWTPRAFASEKAWSTARQIVKQMDTFFSGPNIKLWGLESGKRMNKYFFSPLARKAWTEALISPTWQAMHLRAVKEIGKSIVGRPSVTATRPGYLRYFAAVLGLYGAADYANYVWSQKQDGEGKHIWQNPVGYGFSIRMPWNSPTGRRVYSRPWKSEVEVAEMVGALAKIIKVETGYGEKGERADITKLTSKMSPVINAMIHQLWPQYPFTKPWQRTKQLAQDIGTPIGLGAGGTYALQKLTGIGTPNADYDFITKTLLPFLGAATSTPRTKKPVAPKSSSGLIRPIRPAIRPIRPSR